MPKIKQCFSWWCVAQQATDPKKFFKQMKEIGFAGVELLPRELYDAAREAGLVIVTEMVGAIPRGFNRREHHAELLDLLQEKIELSGQYQIPNLIVFSGNRNGLGDEEGAVNCAEGLRQAVRAAEARNVNLVMELLNSKVDHNDYQCDHTWWGVMVRNMVNSPRLKLLYDIYHMQIMEGDVIRTLQTQLEHIGHIHTAGNPGRNDLDDTQELWYPAIMRAIAATDYDGFVGQEFIPKDDALAGMRAAYNACNV